MDRSEFRTAARELLERHIAEKAPEQEPHRPDITNYPGRWQRGGPMDSDNRAAHYYNKQVNREWFEHQRREQARDNSARADLDQHIKNTGRAPVDREDLKRQFKETAREVTGRDNPPPREPVGERLRHDAGPDRPPPGAAAARIPQSPDKGPDRLGLGGATARNPETSREALNQHIERTENPNPTQMREAARETLRRHLENPDRGQGREQSQDINRPRGLER